MKKLLLVLVLLVPALALAQVPLQVHYQGYLTNAAGQPVNAPTDITVRLYDQPAAGSLVFEETHAAVPVANGVFKVIIGSVQPMALAVFDTARHLSLQAGADAEMTPRLALGTAPFAYVAERANQLSGTATVLGSQIAGNIAGAQVTGTISNATLAGGTLTGLDARYVQAVGNTITTLDAAGNVGEFSSLAIGADGLPVISYHQRTSGLTPGRLKVAKCGNAACTTGTITAVDTGVYDPDGPLGVYGVGRYTSITVGADGLPVIAYLDVANQDLKVAKCANAACTGTSTITTVDSAGDVGYSASIAVGADALPVIAYWDPVNSILKVAKCLNADCTGGATISPLDPTIVPGTGTSIRIGADGLPLITYNDDIGGSLRMVKCVQADCAEGSTFAVVELGAAAGRFSSIAIGDDGLPVISYQGFGGLKVAKCFDAACATGTKIQLTMVDPSSASQYSSIAIGQGGAPLIAYYDDISLDLRLARCANSTCSGTSRVTAVDSAGDVGQYASLAIGADGLPVIAYYDATNGDLKVAKCASQTCAVWQ
jgi:hypothetical protein